MQATKCQCGAITVEINGENYSMPPESFDELFPDFYSEDLEETTYCCDYCVNHWGIDLCGCGSGEKFGEYEEGLRECRRPAQSIELGVTGCSCDNGGW